MAAREALVLTVATPAVMSPVTPAMAVLETPMLARMASLAASVARSGARWVRSAMRSMAQPATARAIPTATTRIRESRVSLIEVKTPARA